MVPFLRPYHHFGGQIQDTQELGGEVRASLSKLKVVVHSEVHSKAFSFFSEAWRGADIFANWHKTPGIRR